MIIEEYQIVTLKIPEECNLIPEFEKDPDWKQISISTLGCSYKKTLNKSSWAIKSGYVVEQEEVILQTK